MRGGEKFNTLSHLAGAALAVTGLVFLLVRAASSGDPWKITGACVYSATLVSLYFFSTLYHSTRETQRLSSGSWTIRRSTCS